MRLIFVGRGFFADGDNHGYFMMAGRKPEKFQEAPSVEALHGTGVQAEGFGGDHQILAGERGAFGGPLENIAAKQRGHTDGLEGM